MGDRLDGKVALITGAARGMGRAEARRFVAEGASVVIADVDDVAGKALADELGGRAAFEHLDKITWNWNARSNRGQTAGKGV